jgi:hypothetical protein
MINVALSPGSVGARTGVERYRCVWLTPCHISSRHDSLPSRGGNNIRWVLHSEFRHRCTCMFCHANSRRQYVNRTRCVLSCSKNMVSAFTNDNIKAWFICRLWVGIATGPVSVSGGARFFSSPQRPDRLWGPPRLLPSGYRGTLSPGTKRPGREADHSPPSSAQVKNDGAIPPLPHTSFVTLDGCLVL